MPRVTLEPENKVAQTNYDYPKLKLKKGEHARILLLEDPMMEYVHTLRKPEVINGVPQMVTKQRKDQSEYLTNKMSFVSRPLCIGDAEVVAEKGSDPKNCPVCKLAKDHPDMAKAPEPRYAMHVIRYRTKSGSFDLATPFSPEVLVWSFTGYTLNTLIDHKKEWKDLRKHDLLLGPCEVEDFQKFPINVGASAAWLEDPSRKALVLETWKENQIPDLGIAIGTDKKREWLEEDVQKVLEAWAEVNGAALNSSTSLDEDLTTLLDNKTPKAKKAEPAPAASPVSADPSDDLDAMLGDLDASPVEASSDDLDDLLAAPAKKPAAKKAAPAPAPEPVAVAAEPDVDNFDDLLADLG